MLMDVSKLRISEKKQAILASMEIHQAEDLLTHYPFRYDSIEQMWQKNASCKRSNRLLV